MVIDINTVSVKRKKIAIVMTSVLQVKFFMIPHIKALSLEYDVTLILKNDYPDILKELNLSARVLQINIARKINPLNDLCTLFSLFFLFKSEHFDLVHTLAPKAGLLGIIAAWVSNTPVRLHTFQGEVWTNKVGFFRWLLKSLDKLTARLATHITVVSFSERFFLEKNFVINEKSAHVIANGSISGVDLTKFKFDQELRENMRKELCLDDTAIVFIFVGRINADKGVPELLNSFEKLLLNFPNSYLLLVGPDEGGIFDVSSKNFSFLGKHLIYRPYTPTPELYMMAADVLVLPSHREGFGMVLIEAAALGLPVIATDIYGIQDAVVNYETGLLFPLGDEGALIDSMTEFASNSSSRKKMGNAARARVAEMFEQNLVVSETIKYYRSIIK